MTENTDFITVTETWGLPASPEQFAMAYARYKLAADMSEGKRVLELGCGCGIGLGYLRRRASIVVGGDRTEALLRAARLHNEDAFLVRLDAARLPFQPAMFDVILMLEMLYYVANPGNAIAECRRALRSPGKLIVCLPNRNRPAFNPSPLSTHYPDASELAELFESNGFRARIYGGFPIAPSSRFEATVGRVRHLAVKWHLIPKSMKAKALIKRLIYRRMQPLIEIHDGMAPWRPLVELDPRSKADPAFKVLYGIGDI